MKPLDFNAPNRDALGIRGDFFPGLLGGLFLPIFGLVLGDFRLEPGLDLGLDLGLTLTGIDRLEEPGEDAFEEPGDVALELLGDPL